MRASPTVTKCLIWLAVLLSPLQSVQGMHLLCSRCVHCFAASDHAEGAAVCCHDDEVSAAACRECNADSVATQEQHACCSRSRSKAPPAAATALKTTTSPVDACQTTTPCPCPPQCECHQPPHAQLLELSRWEWNPGDLLPGFEPAPTGPMHRTRSTAGSIAPPLVCRSSLQTCVALCRLLV
ncbi:hypothetical protein [Lignipirellula cremea]|uniref:Uncharacterized protein n=1 Tax=Lignipirellula cremea TaxID=2528010 RepID=A0A518DPN3_9BACT|nr:hypothetical protein [Lignipirellula cremea]QDU93795.1 hypothetical protein Pla8534_15780 [Lignipirellula cremea]